ncbi:MAG: VOC family protein [Candidatus Thorarchaeota archaeon]
MTHKYPVPYKEDQVYFQYDVKDFNRAKKFYEEVLGFEKTWDGGEEAGWVEFALPVGGARVGLNLKREGEIDRGSGTLTLVVEDLDVTKNYFGVKGVDASDIVDVPDMVSYFNIEDTEGNPIQVVSDPRVKSEKQ